MSRSDRQGERASASAFEKHAHFELWLHTSDSLQALLGQPILGRETLHEWPLSCVQRIRCRDETVIYKAQRDPSVEPAFYRAASSRLLPAHRNLGEFNGCYSMTFEDLAATPLAEQPLEVEALLSLASRIHGEIDEIQGDLPVYTDIGCEARWLAFADRCFERISRGKRGSLFAEVPSDLVPRLRTWAESSGVVELIETRSAFCHGDLNGGNILGVSGALKLIDWQRPRIAPRDVDVAALLLSQGYDAYAHVQREAVQVFFFLLLSWFVESQLEWIPQVDYGNQVLAAASRLLEVPGR